MILEGEKSRLEPRLMTAEDFGTAPSRSYSCLMSAGRDDAL